LLAAAARHVSRECTAVVVQTLVVLLDEVPPQLLRGPEPYYPPTTATEPEPYPPATARLGSEGGAPAALLAFLQLACSVLLHGLHITQTIDGLARLMECTR